jgi:hypothetical protein
MPGCALLEENGNNGVRGERKASDIPKTGASMRLKRPRSIGKMVNFLRESPSEDQPSGGSAAENKGIN